MDKTNNVTSLLSLKTVRHSAPGKITDGAQVTHVSGAGLVRAQLEFQCWICSAREELLHRARVSQWSSGFDMALLESRPEACELKARLICAACFTGFAYQRWCMSGFLEHGDKVFRITLSKKPVKYDFGRWFKYLVRYRPELFVDG